MMNVNKSKTVIARLNRIPLNPDSILLSECIFIQNRITKSVSFERLYNIVLIYQTMFSILKAHEVSMTRGDFSSIKPGCTGSVYEAVKAAICHRRVR